MTYKPFLDELTYWRSAHPDAFPIVKFGSLADVDIGETKDVWDGPSDLYTGQDPTSAATLDLSSTSADDDLTGTGLRRVIISGLDGSLDYQEETVDLDGTTPVSTSGSYLRAFRVKGTEVGSGGTTAGTVTATHSGSSDVMVVIDGTASVARNQSQLAALSIPATKGGRTVDHALLCALFVPIVRANGSAGSAWVNLLVRDDSTSPYRNIRPIPVSTSQAGSLGSPERIEPGADILVRISDISDNNTEVAASFGVLLFFSD